MPELPEVESIKNSLKPNITGKIIKDIDILSSKNFVGNKKDVIGNKIASVDRYGKVLIFKLEKLDKLYNYLNIHFKLSGQMLYAKNINNAIFNNPIPFTGGNKMPSNTTRVIIKFTDNSAIFFNDLRKFGWIKVSKQPLIPKGIDVLDKRFTPILMKTLTHKTMKPIKVLLMDQDLITGIGNIYTNDSLYLAGIHPQRKSNSLNESEINKLHKAIIEEIIKGIKDKGSSGADEAFILPDGSRGNHQRSFLVYQRDGKLCKKCKTIIKRIKHNGRSSFICPKCQPSPLLSS